jgi:hypothetical protein
MYDEWRIAVAINLHAWQYNIEPLWKRAAKSETIFIVD